MADSLTCSKHPKHPYTSTADALSAKGGDTTLLFNGRPPVAYIAGSVNRITVIPAGNDVGRNMPALSQANDLQRVNATSTFFLLDAGVGSFREVEGGGARALHVQCDSTRVAFNSIQDNHVELDWIAPSIGHVPVLLRVAAATSMGNITVNAAILNSTAPSLPSDKDAYACSTSEASTRQCVRVPHGTPGAVGQDECAVTCLTLRCNRCQHVYFPVEDGKGRLFEDLPDDWTCPMCGAPKSAYTKQPAPDGSLPLVHV
jgi:rubredoxin